MAPVRSTSSLLPPTFHFARIGLYVHIPFCAAICNYCNFNRGLLDEPLKAAYVRALVREIQDASDGTTADTIYFGGGTPSLLEPDEVGRIVDACRSSFAFAPDAEVTLELNPETATAERLASFLQAGVNRLSIGVQSFRDAELRRLGRVHDAEKARAAVRLARKAGFDNISVDLMMWLPQQTVAQWLESVDALIETGVEHASLYLLEVYPNAPLREEMLRGGWSQAPDDDAAEMYLRGLERLDAAGLTQYEISNVACRGRQSRHNLKYWTAGEWMAFGCGAHGTRAHRRWRNVSSTTDYVRRIEEGRSVVAEERRLESATEAEEAIFMGLRLTDGLDLAGVEERYGVDVWRRYGESLQPFVESRLLEYTPPVLRLTREGMLLANEVFAVFV
jgi:oxygen-independent coproporphyrinogen-3 oxidase